MTRRLTAQSIQYAMAQLKKGRSPAEVGTEIGVTARHVRRLWAGFCTTGAPHVPQRPGRPARRPAPEEVRLVLDECGREPQGVLRTAMSLRTNHDISYRTVYAVMRENGLGVPSAAKSRRRKWVRYERRHSNAMWHTDWHAMRDSRMKGLNLVTFLDDASRCVTGVGLFTEATSENVVAVLRDAVGRFGAPATILSDNGSCFVGGPGRRREEEGALRVVAADRL